MPSRRHRVRRSEHGIALIETALILPLVFLLFVGMVEAGVAYRDSNILARATQQSARSNARLADNSFADYESLKSLESGLAALDASSISKVIVYDASASGDSPPASCLAISRPDDISVRGNASCNVYSATQVAADDPGQFGCAGGWDTNFCPTTRTRGGNNPTKLGVWVELDFDKVTKVLPGSLSLTRAAVYQLEPCVAGDPTC